MKRLFGFLILICVFSLSVRASEEAKESDESHQNEVFEPADLILHHISDMHVWHIVSWGEKEHQKHIEIPLPIILINDGKIHFFLYSSFDHETRIAESKGSYFLYEHGEIYNTDSKGSITYDTEGHISNSKPWDFSLTKNVWSMWLSVALLIWIFLSVAKMYTGEPGKPKGIQSLFEPIILYVKDDIVMELIGDKKGEKFVPYLLTVFFFIWINNLIGLVPFFSWRK